MPTQQIEMKTSLIKLSIVAVLATNVYGYHAGSGATDNGVARNTAVGVDANANGSTGKPAAALGYKANASKNNAVAIGSKAQATEVNTVAIGTQAEASNKTATAIGYKSIASGDKSTVVGTQAQASKTKSQAFGWHATASGTQSTAIGSGNTNASRTEASGVRSTAIGAGTRATKADSIAIGTNAKATHKNSVALGANSVTTAPNTVSVGSVGDERRITNVADGINPYDAVNMRQFNALGGRVDKLGRKIRGIGAMNSAMSALVPNQRVDSDTQLSVGLGQYDGETAVAMGIFHYDSHDILYNAGISYSKESGTSARVGITWGF